MEAGERPGGVNDGVEGVAVGSDGMDEGAGEMMLEVVSWRSG